MGREFKYALVHHFAYATLHIFICYVVFYNIFIINRLRKPLPYNLHNI